MKKLLKNKLLWLSLGSLPCSVTMVACSKQDKLNDDDIKLKEIKPLSQNQIKLNEILKTLNSNIQEQDLYLKTQQNIPAAIYTELKSAMIYANISNVKVLEKSPSTLAGQVKNSINSIVNVLSINWYWYLDHLSHNTYVFNPFDADYKNLTGIDSTSNQNSTLSTEKNEEKQQVIPRSTQELFDYVAEKYGSYSLTLNDAKIMKIQSFELPAKIKDVYISKYLNFLVLDQNRFIPYFTYNKIIKNEKQEIIKKAILIIPDVFLVLNNDIDGTINAFVQAFKTAYQSIIQSDIDYAVKTGEPNDEQTAAQVYLKHNDANLIQLYNENNYSTIFYKAFMELNKSKMQILRYTWGEIDEN
ncbi:aromatic motif membrane protein [Mycoplasma aquilae ATCC BAA-1896]|uniref:aromatic motif membrane protein n=1 Tax=Mycoplasma aquilae TaxID=1312741 RepID=UPI003A85925A